MSAIHPYGQNQGQYSPHRGNNGWINNGYQAVHQHQQQLQQQQHQQQRNQRHTFDGKYLHPSFPIFFLFHSDIY